MSEADTPTSILGKIGKKLGEEVRVLNDHTLDQTNPHNVTKAQVGLDLVENAALSTFSGTSNITTLGAVTSGSFPYANLTGVPNLASIDEVSGNFTVGGNLTVKGQTTTLETQTLAVEDNIIEINIAADGGENSATSAGIEVRTGTGESLDETLAAGYNSVTFTKLNGNVTEIEVVDSSSVSTTYTAANAFGGATYTITSAVHGNFNSAYNETDNSGDDQAYTLEITADSDDITEIALLDNNSGSSTQVATYSYTAAVPGDKPSILWDTTGQGAWTFNLGTNDANIEVADVTATGDVKVSAGTNIKINSVSLGDFALFDSSVKYQKYVPAITITGNATVNLAQGDSYTDAGATAVDYQGNSATVTTDNQVDTSTAGSYTVTYTASETINSVTYEAEAVRTVIVS